ncbi:phospholipid carrier-dependent glycosyltransferase [Aeromicrobium phragmitis]|uniref:Phospholipid carrier-dependent glycosyltransferase n=1 Tax=Aeromicrobium phragmitis TaxID=2478914 RepID=A0A3L8PMT6_9ACTN|nr:glycosyltransferase family 39 protein [Aeromicrobium phragmitis]RLV56590.1 phospholipid carrier-dependent glycosyltransferase [Aeromicrobium phragmitis]
MSRTARIGLRSRSAEHRFLIVLLVLAAGVRLAAVPWGFPLLLHPDEWAVVDSAVEMARRNSFEPQLFLRPDHLEIKLSYVAFAFYASFVVGAPIEVAFDADPLPFYAMSRLVTVLFGVSAVALGYVVGRMFSPATAKLAAIFIAFFPPLVTNSVYATPDVPLAFVLLAVTYACMRYLSTPGWKPAAWAGALVGVGITIKYPAALAGLAVALVIAWNAVQQRGVRDFLRDAAASFSAMVLAVLVISPVLVTNFTGVREALERESRSTHLGADQLGFWGNLLFYGESFARSAGILLSVGAIAGVVLLVRRRLSIGLPISLGLIFVIAMSALPLHWERWGIPAWPMVLVVAAVAFAAFVESRNQRLRRCGVAVVAVSVTFLVLSSIQQVLMLRSVDTRLESQEWATRNGLTPTNTVFEGYSPFRPGSPATLFSHFEVRDDGTLVPLRPEATQYVVLSSAMYGRFEAEPERYKEQVNFYDKVAAQYQRIATFESTHDLRSTDLLELSIPTVAFDLARWVASAEREKVGPTIEIYKVPHEDQLE